MKTAISLPDAVFRAAERQAKRSQKSRSQLHTEALADTYGLPDFVCASKKSNIAARFGSTTLP